MNLVLLTISSIFLAGPMSASDGLPKTLDLEVMRSIPVQHDGRWMPLDTLARDVVESVTSDPFHEDHDPCLWLLAWTFNARGWMNQPLISIRGAELLTELGLPPSGSVFSYTELANHKPLQTIVEQVSNLQGSRKLDPLESKAVSINQKLSLLRSVFDGQVILLVPDPQTATGTWQAIPFSTSTSAPADPTVQNHVRSAWQQLGRAFLADDSDGFRKAANTLHDSLLSLPAAYRPSQDLISTELRYNHMHPFQMAWMVMVVGALLAILNMPLNNTVLRILTIVAMIAGFSILSYGLWLRWTIAGSIPATNMYESLLFLSWGAGAFAIVSMLLIRDRIIPLTASALGALTLFLADTLPLDSYVRPIAPVLLDTIWMSIHVPVVMASYSVLALAAVIAHAQIVIMSAAPHRKDWAQMVDALHYWYIHVGCILLGAGIITGSMWASSSWGRYWGWDPKEVWSLIAFLGYLGVLHLRISRERVPAGIYILTALLGIGLLVILLRLMAPLTTPVAIGLGAGFAAMVIFVLMHGMYATAVKSILAFWLIIMTYVGVNFMLGIGLHSYGFGTGAVVRYMFLTGGIDLGLVATCTAIYYLRSPRALEISPANSTL